MPIYKWPFLLFSEYFHTSFCLRAPPNPCFYSLFFPGKPPVKHLSSVTWSRHPIVRGHLCDLLCSCNFRLPFQQQCWLCLFSVCFAQVSCFCAFPFSMYFSFTLLCFLFSFSISYMTACFSVFPKGLAKNISLLFLPWPVPLVLFCVFVVWWLFVSLW